MCPNGLKVKAAKIYYLPIQKLYFYLYNIYLILIDLFFTKFCFLIAIDFCQ
jgi:hypothetical protein